MKQLKMFVVLLLILLTSCNLIFPPEESNKDDENPTTQPGGTTNPPPVNSTVELFIEGFDIALNQQLDESQRSTLENRARTGTASIASSNDLTIVVPAIIGAYIEGLGSLTLSETTRFNVLETISSTAIRMLDGQEELINGSTVRAINVNTDALLSILENISEAIVENVPKCGFSENTYAAATETTVKSLIGSLDEGGLPDDTISSAASSITTSAIAQLKESPEYENLIGEAVTSITKGATEGVTDIQLENYTANDATVMIESVTRGAVEGLGEIAESQDEFEALLPDLTEGATLAINEIQDDLVITASDTIELLAEATTEAVKDVPVVTDTDSVITTISTAISQEANENIEGVDTDTISNSVTSGVADGAQSLSNDYDTTTLQEIIVVVDEIGAEQVVDEEIINEGINEGIAEIPADVLALWEALDTVEASGWREDYSLIPDQLAYLDTVIAAYINSDLVSVYDTYGWLATEYAFNMTEEGSQEQLAYAEIAMDVLTKAAYDYDPYNWSAFWALEKMSNIQIHIYRNYDEGRSYIYDIIERFPNDKTKRIIADAKLIDSYYQYLWHVLEPEWDDLEWEERDAYRLNYLETDVLSLLETFAETDYTGFDDWGWNSWMLREVHFRLSEIYRLQGAYEDAVAQLGNIEVGDDDILKHEVDFEIISIYEHIFWQDYAHDDFSGQRDAYINEVLLPLVGPFIPASYPGLPEDENLWRFSSALRFKSELYRYLELYDDALAALTELETMDDVNLYDINQMRIGIYWHKGDRLFDDHNWAGAITEFDNVILIFESVDIDQYMIDYELSIEDKLDFLYGYGDILNRTAQTYNREMEDMESATPYYDSALVVFQDLVPENYPDADPDNWVYADSIRQIMEIFGDTERLDEAILFIDAKLSEDISDRTRTILLMGKGQAYRHAFWSAEDNATRSDYIANAIAAYLLAEELAYNSDNLEEFDYQHAAAELGYSIIDSNYIYMESFHENEQNITNFIPLFEYETTINTLADRMRSLDYDDSRVVEGSMIEAGFYESIGHAYNTDTDRAQYFTTAKDILEPVYDNILSYEADDWAGSSLTHQLFRIYTYLGEIELAEELMNQIAADPNSDEWTIADAMRSIAWESYMMMTRSFDNDNADRDTVDYYATYATLYFGVVYENYPDLDNGNYKRDIAHDMAHLYRDYYYYQLYWNTDTAADIQDTKDTAIAYAQEVNTFDNSDTLQWIIDDLNNNE